MPTFSELVGNVITGLRNAVTVVEETHKAGIEQLTSEQGIEKFVKEQYAGESPAVIATLSQYWKGQAKTPEGREKIIKEANDFERAKAEAKAFVAELYPTAPEVAREQLVEKYQTATGQVKLAEDKEAFAHLKRVVEYANTKLAEAPETERQAFIKKYTDPDKRAEFNDEKWKPLNKELDQVRAHVSNRFEKQGKRLSPEQQEKVVKYLVGSKEGREAYKTQLAQEEIWKGTRGEFASQVEDDLNAGRRVRHPFSTPQENAERHLMETLKSYQDQGRLNEVPPEYLDKLYHGRGEDSKRYQYIIGAADAFNKGVQIATDIADHIPVIGSTFKAGVEFGAGLGGYNKDAAGATYQGGNISETVTGIKTGDWDKVKKNAAGAAVDVAGVALDWTGAGGLGKELAKGGIMNGAKILGKEAVKNEAQNFATDKGKEMAGLKPDDDAPEKSDHKAAAPAAPTPARQAAPPAAADPKPAMPPPPPKPAPAPGGNAPATRPPPGKDAPPERPRVTGKDEAIVAPPRDTVPTPDTLPHKKSMSLAADDRANGGASKTVGSLSPEIKSAVETIEKALPPEVKALVEALGKGLAALGGESLQVASHDLKSAQSVGGAAESQGLKR